MGSNEDDSTQLAADLERARVRIAELEAAATQDCGAAQERSSLLDVTTDAIIATDVEGKIVVFNTAAVELLGCCREEAIGTHFSRFCPPELQEELRALIDQLKNAADGVRVRTERLHSDGRRVPVSMTVNERLDDDGKLMGIMAVMRDITDERAREKELIESQAALKKSEARYRALIKASPLCIHEIDKKGALCSMNPAGLQMMRANHETDIVGRPYLKSVCKDDQARVSELLDRALAGETSFFEFRAAGHRPTYFSSCFVPIKDGDEVTRLMGLTEDITDRVRLEQERTELQERQQQSQKMEAVGLLAGGIAHDFNNVLCAIQVSAALAQEDLRPEDPLQESMSEILQSSQHASALTRQLLAFSRRQVIKPKVIDLSRLVDGMHAMLHRLIGEHIFLHCTSQPQLGRIKVDPNQMEQILLNLVVNARDAMPEGGDIRIETSDVVLDEKFCAERGNFPETGGAGPGAYVVLTVKDSGGGMSDDVRERIFEPFFTTKELGQGTGLGLATVFGIVGQNGGFLDVTSQEGEGSAFRVYFPCVEEDLDQAPAPVPATGPQQGRETVLVVEDEAIVRRLAVRLLQRSGYQVLSAASGTDALEIANAFKRRIDLLLTDVIMPHMNGYELAHKMLAARNDIKVLYTSGYAQDVIGEHGVVDRSLEFIAKPYTPQSLGDRVREVLDGACRLH